MNSNYLENLEHLVRTGLEVEIPEVHHNICTTGYQHSIL